MQNLRFCLNVLILFSASMLIRHYRSFDFLMETKPVLDKVIPKVTADEIVDVPLINLSGWQAKDSGVDFDLSFDFKVQEITDYQSVFQTADGDQGLHLEIFQGTQVVFFYTYPRSDNSWIFFKFTRLEPFQWYPFRLNINRVRLITNIQGDGIQVPAPVDDLSLKSFNRIRFGNGFDGLRKFQGELRNVQIRMSAYRPYRWVNPLVWLLSLALFVYSIFIIRMGYKLFVPKPAVSDRYLS